MSNKPTVDTDGEIKPDDYLSPAGAAKIIPGRPSANCVWRWAVRGYRGIQLRHIRAGSKVFTTEEWVKAFIDACGTANQPIIALPKTKTIRRRTPAQRARALADAERRLANA